MRIRRRHLLAGAGAGLLLQACSGRSIEATSPSPSATPAADGTKLIRDAALTGKPLPARKFIFDGEALDGESLTLRGAGAGLTQIELRSGQLIDGRGPWNRLVVSGLTIFGGQDVIRSSRTEANVSQIYRVEDCEFYGYSRSAISSNSEDMPYWSIEGNVFRGQDSKQTIGVALSGLVDGSVVRNNKFLSNRVHVKLGQGGNNAYVQHNDFLQFDQGSGRCALWVVPAPDWVNSGSGLVVDACKFGNEFLGADDHRILYADEGPGDSFGQRLPRLEASSGYITGHTVRNVLFNGADGGRKAPITSYTPHVSACLYGPLTLAGTLPGQILDFPQGKADEGASNQVGPVLVGERTQRPRGSNVSSAVSETDR